MSPSRIGRNNKPARPLELHDELPLDWTPLVPDLSGLPQESPAAAGYLEQLPFLAWLCQQSLPRTVLTLGATDPTMHFGACAAAAALNLETRCYLDPTSLPGATSKGATGLTRRMDAHHDRHRPHSRILATGRASLMDGLGDATIDLLILQASPATAQQLAKWVRAVSSALSSRSVLLVDGLGSVPSALFTRLAKDAPSFRFGHGTGFGIVITGSAPPAAVRYLASASQRGADASRIRALYELLGAGQRLPVEREQVRAMQAIVDARQSRLYELEEQLRTLEEALTRERKRRLGMAADLKGRLRAVRDELDKTHADARHHKAIVAQMRDSWLWKLAVPLRRLRKAE